MPGGVALLVGENLVRLVKEALASEGLDRVEVISFSEASAKADPSYLLKLFGSQTPRICGMVSVQPIEPPEKSKVPGSTCRQLVLGETQASTSLSVSEKGASSLLTSFLWRAIATAEAEEGQDTRRELERVMSDNAAVLDIMKLVATVRDEEKVVNTVLDLFVTLFRPRCIWYAAMDGTKVVSVQNKGDACGEHWIPPAIAQDSRPVPYHLTEDGFAIRVQHLGSLVGWMDVRRLAYPEKRARYLDMARSIAPIFGLAISNARHIQDLTRMSDALMALNESLNITNKITRHDIRNELVVAHGSIELYRMNGDPAKLEQALRSLGKIDRQLSQLKELDGMLAQGTPLKETALRLVVEDVARNYPMRTTVVGDHAAKVDQAFFSIMDNLFRNAMVHGKAERVEVTLQEAEGMVEVLVADDGKGIDPDIADKIFQEGFSHGEAKGTGIGLFIVSRTMSRYGGSISVRPNSPKGAVFVLRLPSPSHIDGPMPP